MSDYSDAFLKDILQRTKVVAVVGVSMNPVRPSYYVARYLSLKGFSVIPVNPGHAGAKLFGQTVRASLSEISEPVDMVDIFRRSEAVPPIVDEALAAFRTCAQFGCKLASRTQMLPPKRRRAAWT